MARRKATTGGFKTKSKKNKKSKKPKAKKSAKRNRDTEVKKVELGLKDICNALDGLQVEQCGASAESSPLKAEAQNIDSNTLAEFPNRHSTRKAKRSKKDHLCRKTESHISRLFQQLTCSNEPSTNIILPRAQGNKN